MLWHARMSRATFVTCEKKKSHINGYLMELLLDVLLIRVNSQIKLYFKTNGSSFCFFCFVFHVCASQNHVIPQKKPNKPKNAFELSMSHTWPSLFALCHHWVCIVGGVTRCLMLHFTLEPYSVGQKETDLCRSTSVLMSRKRNRCLFFFFSNKCNNKKNLVLLMWNAKNEYVPTVQRLISCERKWGENVEAPSRWEWAQRLFLLTQWDMYLCKTCVCIQINKCTLQYDMQVVCIS